jgi:hypothetical protein
MPTRDFTACSSVSSRSPSDPFPFIQGLKWGISYKNSSYKGNSESEPVALIEGASFLSLEKS